MKKLYVKKFQNKNKKSPAYGKTFGRITYASDATINAIDVAQHIQKHGSIFTPDVVVGVIQRFSQCIEELLQEGYKVKLDGLGTFYLSASTSGEENEEDFNVGNIKSVRIRFLADRSKKYDWNTRSQTTRSSFTFGSQDTENSNASGGSGSSSGSGNDNTSPDQPDVERP